ncbi:class F sortase [Streptomyces sp. NPDC058629]|uniref:class F sortase n=1 Tax=Streptomyces sp. NPDC058629 TaxID=3346565 RepID=UPI0036562852
MAFHCFRGRRGAYTATATACATAGLSLLAAAYLPHQQPPPAPPSSARAQVQPPTAPTGPGRQAPVLPVSEPVRITARSIGLAAPVEAVGTAKDGSVALPADPGRAGWYTGSPTPGERGNAILAAHLDSTSGPAAFYSLGALRQGDRITVEREDGRDAHFTVTAMHVYAKSSVPSETVYGPTAHPQLTLITCADWDRAAKEYRANLVITAHPTTGNNAASSAVATRTGAERRHEGPR